VIGFKDGMTAMNPSMTRGCIVALAITTFLFVFMALGVILPFQEHNNFLWGIGNLSSPLPWARRMEPDNALSIPTWTIHIMSVTEYIVAMKLVWDFSTTTNNSRWKGLTFGMLPMHASSICAVTHHFFYNNPDLLCLVTIQGFLTLFGNITTMIAAWRIAKSNGWTLLERRAADNGGTLPLELTPAENTDSNAILLAKLVAFTVVLSYVIKYGELNLIFPATPNACIALSLIVGVPAITASYFVLQSIRSRRLGELDESLVHQDGLDEESPLLKK
jgi:hypothetical protein